MRKTSDLVNEMLAEAEMDMQGNVNYEEFCKKLVPERPPPVK